MAVEGYALAVFFDEAALHGEGHGGGKLLAKDRADEGFEEVHVLAGFQAPELPGGLAEAGVLFGHFVEAGEVVGRAEAPLDLGEIRESIEAGWRSGPWARTSRSGSSTVPREETVRRTGRELAVVTLFHRPSSNFSVPMPSAYQQARRAVRAKSKGGTGWMRAVRVCKSGVSIASLQVGRTKLLQ